jgi:hypothetical protein
MSKCTILILQTNNTNNGIYKIHNIGIGILQGRGGGWGVVVPKRYGLGNHVFDKLMGWVKNLWLSISHKIKPKLPCIGKYEECVQYTKIDHQ